MDDKYEHVLALNRARQARWRKQNKEKVAERGEPIGLNSKRYAPK
jgi:hypothetical protein